jgi:hypothetical protein
MFKRLQGFLAGILIGTLLMGGVAYAAGAQALQATFHNIKLVVDGNTITPTDASGNAVEPFIVNGTTYLPVRAVADALGKEVYWDGPNWTVYLGNMGGALQTPTLRLQDAVNIGDHLSELKSPVDNYGNQYGSAYYDDNRYSRHTFETLLNMKYSRFKGTFFAQNGTTIDTIGDFKIEIDGNVVYTSPEITKTSAPINVDVSIVGGNDFKIILNQKSGVVINIGDSGFYQ